MESEPLAVIKIGGTDGVIIPLHIFRGDDPTVLAKKFVDDNGLPNEIVVKLSALIKSHIFQALSSSNESPNENQSYSQDNSVESVTNQFANLLNRGSQYRNFDNNSDNLSPSTFTPVDRDEVQTPSHSHHFEESFNKAKETWSSTANRNLVDTRRTESISMVSNMKKSRSDSNLNVSLSGSINDDARSVSRPRSPSALSVQSTPNRSVYHRLYQEASHSQQRLSHLRDRVEEEREDAVWSSSFM